MSRHSQDLKLTENDRYRTSQAQARYISPRSSADTVQQEPTSAQTPRFQPDPAPLLAPASRHVEASSRPTGQREERSAARYHGKRTRSDGVHVTRPTNNADVNTRQSQAYPRPAATDNDHRNPERPRPNQQATQYASYPANYVGHPTADQGRHTGGHEARLVPARTSRPSVSSQSSRLSYHEQRLMAAVGSGDHLGSVGFIDANRTILTSFNDQGWIAEAIKEISLGHKATAMHLLEKLVLIREYKAVEHDRRDRKEFLERLRTDKKGYQSSMDLNVRKLMEVCDKQVASRPSPGKDDAPETDTSTRPHGLQPAARTQAGGRESDKTSPLTGANTKSSRHTGDDNQAKEQHYMLTSTKAQVIQQPMIQQQLTHQYRSSRHQSVATISVTDTDDMSLDKVSVRGSAEFRVAVEYTNANARKVGLTDDFKIYRGKDAKKFFCKGRVFMAFIHKEQSEIQTQANAEAQNSHVVWNEKLGVNILSYKQRYVVVKEGTVFVRAVPINTDRGQGMFKSGFKPHEIAAHAIAYTTPKPETLSGRCEGQLVQEPKMVKEPIRVVPYDKDLNECKLERASRINFMKPTTIEHNVRVFNVGRVHADSMPFLINYWKKHA